MNERFNRLTLTGNSKVVAQKRHYEVRCDCGALTFATMSQLRTERKKSCGCLLREAASGRKDLAGQKFGFLTVLGYSGTMNRRAMWKAACICGSEDVYNGKFLRNGNTKSCGCRGISSRVGAVFGKLTVVEMRSEVNGGSSCLAKCECGVIHDVQWSKLIHNQTKSCGCSQYEKKRSKSVVHIGKRFGKLVIESLDYETAGGASANCLCDCGAESRHSLSDMVQGKIRSCGCMKSSQQEEIFAAIKAVCPDAKREVYLSEKRMRYDIVVPSKTLAIEFNGVYWHSEANGKDRRYHIKKRLVAEKEGYRLISVWENDYIENQDRVMSLLMSAVGVTKKRHVAARKLIVKTCNGTEASSFHKTHHIQKSSPNGGIHLALFEGEEMLACATFKDHEGGSLELTRYTVKEGVSIAGGLMKLVSKTNAAEIVTYADRDYFTGDLYSKSGFVRTGTSLQLSYWEKRTNKRHRRERFMKHKLPSLGIEVLETDTEKSALERAGIYQCWNSGIDRWVFTRQSPRLCVRRGPPAAPNHLG